MAVAGVPLPLLLLLPLPLLLPSCSIRGSFQGLYGYYHKTLETAPGLVRKAGPGICDSVQTDPPVVYAIDGKNLRCCLEQHEKSLVYLWRPKCSSDLCLSLRAVQEYCDARGIELFVVAEYYDAPSMRLNHPVERPVFGVDCDHYATDLTGKYLKVFFNELLGEKTNVTARYYFLFRHGVLTRMSDNLQGATEPENTGR